MVLPFSKNPDESPLPATASALEFPEVRPRVEVLPNGLTLIVQEDHGAPVASVQAWVSTGSIHEGRWLGSGISHFLEHLLFKGTEKRGANAIAQAVQDEGGYINAYTSFDRTVYWIDVPAPGVDAALDVLADATMNSVLPAGEFTKEQEVIRREFAMGADDPDRVNGHLLFATAFREHPCRHPVIGHLALFNRLTRDDVLAYYKSRYVPNNMAIVVTGDVDADAVSATVRRLFEPHEARVLEPVFLPPEPPPSGRREGTREFTTELSRVIVAWHGPGLLHSDTPALEVLATLAGSGRSSRLYRRVRETGLAHQASAWNYTPAQAGLWGMDLLTDPARHGAALEAGLAVVAELRRDGPTEAEVRKAQRQILASNFHTLATMRGQASDLGGNWLLTGNLNFTREFLAALAAVTPEDVRRVAQRYLDPEQLILSAVHPPGAARKAAPARGGMGGAVQKFTLANGLRLLVREDPRLPLVSIQAAFQGGVLAERTDNAGIGALLARMLVKGTSARSAEQIADELEAVGGSIGAGSGNNSLTLAIEVLRPDLPLGLDLLADILLRASLPAEHLERERAVQIAALQDEDEHMTAAARNLLRANLFPGHAFAQRPGGTAATVGSLTREAVAAHRDRLLVARNGVLAIFGPVSAAEVLARCEALLDAMPADGPVLAELVPPPPPAAATHEARKKDKEQAVLMIGYQTPPFAHPDALALDVIEEACGDLGSRFFVRIREEMGLAYFVGGMQLVGLAGSGLVFYLGTDPAKLGAVRAVFESEIAALARDGLTPEEFARAKKKLLGQNAIGLQSNAGLAARCALDELYGVGFDDHLRLRADLDALTLEGVRDVARRWLLDRPSVTAVARPETEAEVES